MNEEKDFLDEFAEEDAAERGVEAAEDVTDEIVDDAPAEEAASGDGPARGPDGKFIRKEAATTAEDVEKGAQENAQEPPSESEETTVPISVVQALRNEIKELKAGRQQQPSQPAPEPPARVNPEQDPFGYLNQSIQSVQEAQFDGYLNQSELIARQMVGDEPVDAALEEFKTDGDNAAWQKIVSDKHPYGALLQWHKENQTTRQLREAGSLEALIEKRAQELLEAKGQPAATAPATTPPSLAKRGGGKGQEVVSEEDAFNDMFDR